MEEFTKTKSVGIDSMGKLSTEQLQALLEWGSSGSYRAIQAYLEVLAVQHAKAAFNQINAAGNEWDATKSLLIAAGRSLELKTILDLPSRAEQELTKRKLENEKEPRP